jgi:senataxin
MLRKLCGCEAALLADYCWLPLVLQGREKDVVIFSCVRTAGVHHRSIGFVADERRINVGITRARCALLIIGHAASLVTDDRWRNLVGSAVERKCLYQPSKPYSSYMQQVRTDPC